MNLKNIIWSFFFWSILTTAAAQQKSSAQTTPIMGWSSWNNFRVNVNESNKGYTMQDLWKTKDFGPLNVKTQTFEVPKHGVVVLKIIGEAIPFNVFQSSK